MQRCPNKWWRRRRPNTPWLLGHMDISNICIPIISIKASSCPAPMITPTIIATMMGTPTTATAAATAIISPPMGATVTPPLVPTPSAMLPIVAVYVRLVFWRRIRAWLLVWVDDERLRRPAVCQHAMFHRFLPLGSSVVGVRFRVWIVQVCFRGRGSDHRPLIS